MATIHKMTRAEMTEEHRRSVCKLGQGHDCCRYVTMSAGGWDCQKHTDMGRHLDARVQGKTMVARGDNCGGVTHDD